MSITLVSLLLASTFIPLVFGKRRVALLLLTLTAIVGWSFGSGWPARLALIDLQKWPKLTQPEWKSRNAIVLLGVGTVRWPVGDFVSTQTLGYPRAFEAARLYFDCKKTKRVCVVLTTGGDPSRTDHPEAEVMARELESAGVARADMIVEPKSNNTFQNASFSAPLLAGFDQITLVTSGVHLERSRLYFAHFVGDVTPAPADYLAARFSFWPSSYGFTFFDLAAHEWLGVWRYHFYNWAGWNPAVSKPGSL